MENDRQALIERLQAVEQWQSNMQGQLLVLRIGLAALLRAVAPDAQLSARIASELTQTGDLLADQQQPEPPPPEEIDGYRSTMQEMLEALEPPRPSTAH